LVWCLAKLIRRSHSGGTCTRQTLTLDITILDKCHRPTVLASDLGWNSLGQEQPFLSHQRGKRQEELTSQAANMSRERLPRSSVDRNALSPGLGSRMAGCRKMLGCMVIHKGREAPAPLPPPPATLVSRHTCRRGSSEAPLCKGHSPGLPLGSHCSARGFGSRQHKLTRGDLGGRELQREAGGTCIQVYIWRRGEGSQRLRTGDEGHRQTRDFSPRSQ
jgi:hypothetical protein